VKTLDGLHAALGRLDLSAVGETALASAAAAIEMRVRAALSHPVGGAHAAPWLRSGGLLDSISHQTVGTEAVVGSTSLIAVYQELGTRTDPPRPFLAPAAMLESEATANLVAESVVVAIAAALAGDRA
jgi:phage gpG-like protein